MSKPITGTDLDSVKEAISKPRSAFNNTTPLDTQIHLNAQLSVAELWELLRHAHSEHFSTSAREVAQLQEQMIPLDTALKDIPYTPNSDIAVLMQRLTHELKNRICNLVEQRWQCEERMATQK